MEKSPEILRMEKDLRRDPELGKKLDTAMKEAAASGACSSDGEALVKAAQSLGYDFSLADLERDTAAVQELDPEEMKNTAGGQYVCFHLYDNSGDDEYGHGAWCLTAWHCLAATLHTDSSNPVSMCWSDYRCMVISEGEG